MANTRTKRDIDFFSGGAPVQTPADLPGLLFWLDATDVNGTGTNPANGPLGTWVDKSGNVNDANTRNAGERPEVATASLNGRNTVYFDATEGDVLDFGADITLDEVFLVFASDANQPNRFPTPISDREVGEDGLGNVVGGFANFHGRDTTGNLLGQPIWTNNVIFQGDYTEAATTYLKGLLLSG